MARVFSVSCAALSAINTIDDDRHSHWVTASVPSLNVYPIRSEFRLTDMISEAGWTVQRPVELWVEGSPELSRARVMAVQANSEARELNVTIAAYRDTDDELVRSIRSYGRRAGLDTFVRLCVKIGRVANTANTALEAIASKEVFKHVDEDSLAYIIMDKIYGADRRHLGDNEVPYVEDRVVHTIRGRQIALTDDQRDALGLVSCGRSIVAIQAAFGTGKTVLGAIIAARYALKDKLVIVTASTNAAVAQFTNSILAIEEFRGIETIRYVSGAALLDDAPTTPIDMHKLLLSFGDDQRTPFTSAERSSIAAYVRGRRRYEEFIQNPEGALTMSKREPFESMIAERDVSIHVAAMIRMYVHYRGPRIVCLTTSSLLNTTAPKGCFAEYLESFDVVIGDEASQIPEPVFVAIADRLPEIRHVYIGDVHQLEPHARCPRSSNPAVFGARSVMSALTASARVPVAPLVTTFRAHPSLNELPNQLTCGGTLVSGADAAERHLLLDLFEYPDVNLPFLFVDVAGTSQRAVTKSHFNEVEATVCLTIVTELTGKGVRADQICVITFYREQYRKLAEPLREMGIELSTVDTVQGREKDVVILLTTKTGFEPEAAEFLDDQRRMNVALTRSRHGQFVLGYVESLRPARHWSGVLEWATAHNAVLPASDLPRFFRSD